MLTNKELMRVEPRAFVRRMLRDFDRFFEGGWAEFEWVPTLEVVERTDASSLVSSFRV